MFMVFILFTNWIATTITVNIIYMSINRSGRIKQKKTGNNLDSDDSNVATKKSVQKVADQNNSKVLLYRPFVPHLYHLQQL